MSRELVTPGQPLTVAAVDRTFGAGRPNNVLVVSDGYSVDTPKVATNDFGNVKIGGRSVLGDPTLVSTSGLASNTVTMQLRDANGNPVLEQRVVYIWLSTTALGATPAGTTGLTTTISTGVLINTVVANLQFQAMTDVTGKLVVTLADATGGETRFVNIVVDDRPYASTAVIAAP